jgi:hypothetical protein
MSGLKLSLGSMGIQPTEQVKQAKDGGEGEEVEEEDAFEAAAVEQPKPNYNLKMFDKLNPGKGDPQQRQTRRLFYQEGCNHANARGMSAAAHARSSPHRCGLFAWIEDKQTSTN